MPSTLRLLSPRLYSVYSLCGEGNIMADIGTDHGYLPCALVEEGKYRRAFASDIAPGPMDHARRQIAMQHLEGRVTPLIAPGMEGLSNEPIDTVAIAGMGGEMIRDILKPGRGKRSRLILQPMTTEERLRYWLFGNGYMIEKECLTVEEARIYTVMSVTYTGRPVTASMASCYLGRTFLDNPPDLARRYIGKKLAVLQKALKGNGASARAEAQEKKTELEKLIGEIERYADSF